MIGDTMEITEAVCSRGIWLFLQPRLGKYALVDLPSPVIQLTGVSTNVYLIALLKVFSSFTIF